VKSKVFFPNLDGLRMIAFLCVFLQHSGFGSLCSENLPSGLTLFTNVLCNGALGVDFFFVLSGFLITYLMLKEESDTGSMSVSAFYIRRVLRIWPLYYAVFLGNFVFYPLVKAKLGIHSNLASRWVYYLVFLSNFDVIHTQRTAPGHDAMTENVMWSVSVEEQFYLIWPLIMTRLPRVATIVVMIVLSTLYRVLHPDDPLMGFQSIAAVSFLGTGALAACMVSKQPRFLEWIACLTQTSVAIAYITGITILILKANGLLKGPLVTYSDLVVGIFFAFVVLEQNYSSGSLFKIGRFKAVSFWGKYTYGLYLLHPWSLLIIADLRRVLGHSVLSSFGNLALIGVEFALSLTLAI
jgi:peptidoglycan/LPS O-acetylase OafA/YrhL